MTRDHNLVILFRNHGPISQPPYRFGESCIVLDWYKTGAVHTCNTVCVVGLASFVYFYLAHFEIQN